MFGIGWVEFVIILVFGFLIFGPDKLPEIAKTVASAINKFRGAQSQMTDAIKTGVYDPKSDEPFKNPLDILSSKDNEKSAEASASKAQSTTPEQMQRSKIPEKTDSAQATKTESLAERKAKYNAKQAKTEAGKKATEVTDEKPAAKKTVKRAPAKKDAENETNKETKEDAKKSPDTPNAEEAK